MDTNNRFAFIITNAGDITVLTDGTTHQVATDHPNYQKILDDLNTGNYQALKIDLDIEQTLQAEFATENITIKAGVVYYRGQVIHN